jgi:hypothetical protein
MKAKSEKQYKSLYRYILNLILLVIGVLLLYGYHLFNISSDIKQYQDLASSDPSGFRFIVFLGIIKYVILIVGLTIIISTIILLIREIINKNAT